uniref:NAD(P)H-quinone oxidoreductase subunit 6, chloroplastic n=1 Tax=Osmundastrum cinnamomeum TaxID=3284 RepID=A0A059SS49_OSMCI|nr:NADH-plastoquinone oxidoreductase subunit 6 [Osmundastrum cinnamomeum]AHA59607.1 NADH-plastoquinone oxidoreductase subunit 6 [Osmundastrum cinnamomeum]
MNLPESIHDFILILVELGILSGSSGVVLLANIVYSAFLLGLVSICISLLYLVLNADFVAAAQLLIYVGAINVLIVFAVMLINKSKDPNPFPSRNAGDGITSGVCISLFLLLTITIRNTEWSDIRTIEQSESFVGKTLRNNVQLIGSQLLTNFLIPFELLSILLLIASVGAITMARREGTIGTDKNVALQSKDDSFFSRSIMTF